jgi:hypothetical protein
MGGTPLDEALKWLLAGPDQGLRTRYPRSSARAGIHEATNGNHLGKRRNSVKNQRISSPQDARNAAGIQEARDSCNELATDRLTMKLE